MIKGNPGVGLVRFRGRFPARTRVIARPYFYGRPFYRSYPVPVQSLPCPTTIELSSQDIEALAQGRSLRLVGANQCGQAVQVTVRPPAPEAVSGLPPAGYEQPAPRMDEVAYQPPMGDFDDGGDWEG